MKPVVDMAQRTRLAAGLLHCDESEVQARVDAMTPIEKRSLSSCINWLVDYESAESGKPEQVAA